MCLYFLEIIEKKKYFMLNYFIFGIIFFMIKLLKMNYDNYDMIIEILYFILR